MLEPVAGGGTPVVGPEADWISALGTEFDVDTLGVEYQPLVKLRTGAVIGYEALARFRDSRGCLIDTAEVFDALHNLSGRLFFQAERRLKRIQIGRAPLWGRLFLNFDPCGMVGVVPELAMRLARGLFAGRPNIVVEMVENSALSDRCAAETITRGLVRTGFPIALDDIGAPGTVLSIEQMKAATFLKFDRNWLSDFHGEEPYLPRGFLNVMLAFARRTGKTTVLEGVETPEQLAFAERTGFDAVQGFLFRDRFLSSEEPARESRPDDVMSCADRTSGATGEAACQRR